MLALWKELIFQEHWQKGCHKSINPRLLRILFNLFCKFSIVCRIYFPLVCLKCRGKPIGKLLIMQLCMKVIRLWWEIFQKILREISLFKSLKLSPNSCHSSWKEWRRLWKNIRYLSLLFFYFSCTFSLKLESRSPKSSNLILFSRNMKSKTKMISHPITNALFASRVPGLLYLSHASTMASVTNAIGD